jgi:hypothetical protein
MAEHRCDRFESHPTVDRLGRERVPQLVWVHVAEPGACGDATHDPGHLMPAEWLAVMMQQEPVDGRMIGDPVDEQSGSVRVQWDEPVVVEFADRDPQPGSTVEFDDCVTFEGAELTDTHPGSFRSLTASQWYAYVHISWQIFARLGGK